MAGFCSVVNFRRARLFAPHPPPLARSAAESRSAKFVRPRHEETSPPLLFLPLARKFLSPARQTNFFYFLFLRVPPSHTTIKSRSCSQLATVNVAPSANYLAWFYFAFSLFVLRFHPVGCASHFYQPSTGGGRALSPTDFPSWNSALTILRGSK